MLRQENLPSDNVGGSTTQHNLSTEPNTSRGGANVADIHSRHYKAPLANAVLASGVNSWFDCLQIPREQQRDSDLINLRSDNQTSRV